MTHSPAPWRVVPIVRNKRNHIGDLCIFGGNGHQVPIARVGPINTRRPSPRAVADANLMKAAPTMLVALKAAEAHIAEDPVQPVLAQVRAAISEAEVSQL